MSKISTATESRTAADLLDRSPVALPPPSGLAPARRPAAAPAFAVGVALLGLLFGGACGPALGTPPGTCSTTAVSAGESPLMEPGGDCIDCHSSNNGPGFTFAGTVMNAARDDQNCQGMDAVSVRITDAAGKVIEMTTNASGNFYSTAARSSIAFPYTAEVSRNGKTVRMLTPRSAAETNCASCHTAAGANGAPGRILPP